MYQSFSTFFAKIFPYLPDIVQEVKCCRVCFRYVITQIPSVRLWSNDNDRVSNSYGINCDFSMLLSGVDEKKFCFGISHEQLVLIHPPPAVLNATFDRSNCISLARVRLGTKQEI